MASELSRRERELSAALCERYVEWAPGETRRPQVAKQLDGGHSNRVLLIAGERQHWVLRIAGKEGPVGLCRSREEALQREAARRGFAAPIVWSDPQNGTLLMEYLPASNPLFTPQDIAILLRKVHTLPVIGQALDADSVLLQYQAEIDSNGKLAKLLNRNQALIEEAQQAIASRPSEEQVLCHNDLLAANRGWHGQRMIAFDWEYAAPANAMFDLAVCASELDRPASNALLAYYLERSPNDEEYRRYRAFQLVYLCLECCWHARFADKSTQAKHLPKLKKALEGPLMP